MKKILLFALVLMLLFISNPYLVKAQTAGFNTTYIIINNGATDTYYDLQASTGNPDFNGADLGTFCFGASNALVFKGAEHNVYKCGSCDLTSTRIYYKIYLTSSPSGPFISNDIPYFSGFNNGCGGQDQVWKKTDYSIDLLSGLPAGNYTMEVYSDASITCLEGTVYAGNGGANYKATFVVRPDFTAGEILSTGQTICSGGDPAIINSATDASGGDDVITYKWQANGSEIPDAISATYNPPANITTTTTYTRFAHDGTCNTSFTLSSGSWVVTVNPTSIGGAISGGTNVCSGTNSTVLTLADQIGSVVKWQYSINGGTNWVDIVNTETTHTAIDLTTNTQYQAIVKSGECLSATSLTATITVSSGIPTSVSAAASPNPVCEGTTLTLTGDATGATSWSWTGPNGFVSTAQNPQITSITSAASGIYSLIASNGCGAAEVATTSTVVVNPLPTDVSAVATPNPICAGGTLTLTGSASDATSWSWTGPDGFISSDQSPTIAGITADYGGVYILTAGNACGSATPVSTLEVIINTPVTPLVSIVASANPITSGTSVTFTATPVNGGATPSYAWFIGTAPSGFNAPTLVFNPSDGATIKVEMTSSLACVSPATVTSNIIIMEVSTAPAATTWDGSFDNNWHNADNWSAGVPGSTTVVTIPSGITNFPTISNSATCKNFTLKSGASILGNNYLTVTSTTSVERFFAGNEWHLLSSPIVNANTGMFTGKYLQYHNTADNNYHDIISADSVITVAKGYAVWGGNGFTSTFVGPMNTNTKTYSVSAAGEGWNLVGNPFPSGIDWDLVVIPTGIANAIYKHVNSSTWATYIDDVSIPGENDESLIAPCQGFFVKATGNATLQFKDAARIHAPITYYKQSNDRVSNLVRLQVSGNGYQDETVVRFLPEATAEFDGSYDALKINGDVTEAAQIFSWGGIELAINSLPETNMVPVGIHVGTTGTYTIAATEINDLNYVTLEDTKTGVFTELATKPYTFDFTTGENEQRFKLHFSSVGVDEKETTTANIYSYQQTVYVNLSENTKGDIYVYNLAGQLITAQESASGNVRIGLNSIGVYMVKVVTEKETLTHKVVIR